MSTPSKGNDECLQNFPTLEYLAFETVYYQLVCKTTPNTIEHVRNCMDQQLIGRVKKSVREKCIERWNLNNGWDRLNTKLSQDLDLDVEIFMDCILDCNFVQLEIGIPLSGLKSFSVLMSIIAHRSPKLRELKINLHALPYDQQTTLENSKEKTDQLISLHHLQFLTIGTYNISCILPRRYVNNKSYQSILSIVGKCCPSLIKLKFYGFPISKRDILALLIAGDVADVLFPYNNDGRWSRDPVLESLRLPFQYLNPLCFTLEELSLKYNTIWKDSTLTFALCHLPKLRILETKQHGLDTVNAIKTIYRVEETLKQKVVSNWIRNPFKSRKKSRQVEQEEVCRKADVPRKSIGGFSGFLPLEKIEFIQLSDKESVKAVGSLCPQLKDIGFFENSRGPYTFPDELDPILNGWSKVNILSLIGILPECVEPVLHHFIGSTLKSLTLISCGQINLAFLESCTQLENLTLHRCSIEPKAPTDWSEDKTFLPLLKKFENYELCLGSYWASLIERKSTIVHLTLDCCHIGTSAYDPRLEWSQVADLWPNLETLELHNCTGLTMSALSENIIPRLGKLRSVKLPHFILCKDHELNNKIIKDLRNRSDDRQVEISDNVWSSSCWCPFQLPV